jgi:hypothetical protein
MRRRSDARNGGRRLSAPFGEDEDANRSVPERDVAGAAIIMVPTDNGAWGVGILAITALWPPMQKSNVVSVFSRRVHWTLACFTTLACFSVD